MKPPQSQWQFLTVHPRTAAWWKERETCLKCRHMTKRPAKGTANGSGSGHGMYCTAVAVPSKIYQSCISTRERECGPEAKLYEARAENTSVMEERNGR